MTENIPIKKKLSWQGFSLLKYFNFPRLGQLMLIAIAIWLLLDFIGNIAVDLLWFQEVNYLPFFQKRLITKGILWAIALSVTGSFFWINLAIANRCQYPKNFDFLKADESPETMLMPPVTMPSKSQPVTPALGLRFLSLFIFGLILLISVILIHYIAAALNYWHTDLTLPQVSPGMPLKLGFESTAQLIATIPSNFWELGVIIVVAVAVIANPLFSLRAIAIFLSLIFGFILSSHWANILQFITIVLR